MSSVAIANQIINWNHAESSAKEKASSRNSRNIYGTEQKLFGDKNSRPNSFQQQPINFGDEGEQQKKNNSRYGQTTREAVKPDNNAYFRQNANINTIKIRKPKTPEQHESNGKPVNAAKTAASEVINEFRQKYMNQGNNGESPTNDHLDSSAHPHDPRRGNTMFTRPRPNPTKQIQNGNDFSFISNDFEDPAQRKPTTKGPPRNENVVHERGNDIPVDQVLSTYKNSRLYKEPQQQQQPQDASQVPRMTPEEVEKEKRRNEELNARLRGYAPPRYTQDQAIQQQNNMSQHQQQDPNQYKDHVYQSLKQYKKDAPRPTVNGHRHGNYLNNNNSNNNNNFKFNKQDSFSFLSEATIAQGYDNNNNQNIFNQQHGSRDIHSAVSTPRAEQLAEELNNNSSPYIGQGNKRVNSNNSNYVLTESYDKKFDINEVLNGYKSKHVYKKNEENIDSVDHAQQAMQQFKMQNQRNSESEQVGMEKRKGKLNGDHHINNNQQEVPINREQYVFNQEEASYNTQPHRDQAHRSMENNFRPIVEPYLAHSHLQQTSGFVDTNEQTFSYSNQARPKKTPEPKIGPSKAEMSSNQRFIEHRTRSATQIERDDEGWVRMEPQKKFNPGPTTQAREYFNHNRSDDHEKHFSMDEPQVYRSHSYEFQRTNSSKSNPNVTFGKKHGQDIIAEYQQSFQNESPYSVANHRPKQPELQQMINQPTLTKSKSEPHLGPDPNGISTDLSRLNFSNMESNLRRSKYRKVSGVYGTARSESAIRPSVYAKDDYVIVDSSSPNPKFVNDPKSSKSTISSKHSMQSFGDSTSSFEKSKTTVMLARGWSGKITSSSEETKQVYDYNLKLGEPASNNINELVFRSNKPIEQVKATDRKSDALDSLTSLDRRLRSESGMNRMLFTDSMEWMGRDNISHNPDSNPNVYRESSFPKSDFVKLDDQVRNSGYKEGQDMRGTFYESLQKITKLVNQLLESMPKESFPFKIRPCSYQGDFEKKGPEKIDIYLNIEDLKQYQHQVNFLLKKDLAAYILLKGEKREKLKQFCARNRDNGQWVLSAARLMVVFAYTLNTKVRPLFEYNSKSKRKDIVSNARVEFVVSENEVCLKLSFPENPDLVYRVGLLLAFNVSDFPNIIDMNKNRKWPDSEGKAKFIKGGTHLMAVPSKVKNHAWAVSFLKTRKILLSHCEDTATSILLALQVINKTALSKRNCSGLLLPVHFIMILFWVHESYRDRLEWKQDKLSQRLLDVLIALKRCLEKKICPDFFFPKLNYFETLDDTNVFHLLQNVNEVLEKPQDHLH